MSRKPFFYDITLRDGNQALKKPWNLEEKEKIFNTLIELNVDGIEIGFPHASNMDFESTRHLATIAPKNVVVSGLARTKKEDIDDCNKAICEAFKPRIHTFVTLSPFHLEYVLNKSYEEVARNAVEAVKYARSILKKEGEIEFSVEHFGDCGENLDVVIKTLNEIVKAGATIINLPNTVERYRPKHLVEMVEKVYKAMPNEITISVHNHNDLGMATATTVESYFVGATQLECCLNGLGERCGNTNFYEVAVALHNCGVETDLNYTKFYETAVMISEMSKVEIPEKSPLIGKEALAHRSGIHQDGAIKTKDMEMGAYRPIKPSMIGRENTEQIGFTSQSGKTAIFDIISGANYPITMQEAIRITPYFKQKAELVGELNLDEMIKLYFDTVFEVKGPFKLIAFKELSKDKYKLKFEYNEKLFELESNGNGPVDACLMGLRQAGFEQKLLHYEQKALDEDKLGSGAHAMSVIYFEDKNKNQIIARACDTSTQKANVKAIFNGLNILSSSYKDGLPRVQ